MTMNLVGSYQIRNKIAQIIPLALGAILSQTGEYSWWQDVAGDGYEAGAGYGWLLLKLGYLIPI